MLVLVSVYNDSCRPEGGSHFSVPDNWIASPKWIVIHICNIDVNTCL